MQGLSNIAWDLRRATGEASFPHLTNTHGVHRTTPAPECCSGDIKTSLATFFLGVPGLFSSFAAGEGTCPQKSHCGPGGIPIFND